MTLFRNDRWTARTRIGLLRQIHAHFDKDPYYVASVALGDRRKRFEALWPAYEPYADGYFASQLTRHFNDRTWEMYVGNVLLQAGFMLQPAGNHGPDLRIVSPVEIDVEAVAATTGIGPDSVPDLLFGEVGDYPEEQILLRLANAVESKAMQRRKHLLAGVARSQTSFVLALTSGAIPHVEDDAMPLLLKAVFGIGHRSINLATRELSWTPRPSIKKQSGATVSMLVFRDPAYAHISACLYSPGDVLNHPEPLGRDCVVIHNPLASNPLPPNIFSTFEQWRAIDETELQRIPSTSELSAIDALA